MKDCLPCDWNDGWSNITIGCSVENQINAEKRLPIFLALPIKHRLIVAAPLLEGIDLKMWLDPNLIECVSIGGESGKYARALDFAWVEKICRQCRDAGIDFSFHQTGSYLLKDGRKYHIPRNIQHSQAEKALEYLKNII